MFFEQHHESISTAAINTATIDASTIDAAMIDAATTDPAAIDMPTTHTTTAVNAPSTPTAPASKRGFASMDPSRRRLVARKGGQTAHQLGKAHRFNSEEAKTAGRKGLESRKHKVQPQAQSEETNAAVAGAD